MSRLQGSECLYMWSFIVDQQRFLFEHQSILFALFQRYLEINFKVLVPWCYLHQDKQQKS